jgi:hypothetical protein
MAPWAPNDKRWTTPATVAHEAGSTGFEPESIEKVVRLVGLLDGLHRQSNSARRRVSRVDDD